MPVLVILGVIGLFVVAGYGIYLSVVDPIKKPGPRVKARTPQREEEPEPELAPPALTKPGQSPPADVFVPKLYYHKLEWDFTEQIGILPTPKLEIAPPLPTVKRKPKPKPGDMGVQSKPGSETASEAKPFGD